MCLSARNPLGHPAPKERAPLRQANDPNLSTTQVQVIPLPRSGLHCGWPRHYPARRTRPVIPLPRSGAPLRRVGVQQVLGGGDGHPAPKERAPLRLRGRPPLPPSSAKSSRSQGAGSIAARPPRLRRPPWRQVIPLPRSGLHCGSSACAFCLALGFVIPLPRSGLHCGCSSMISSRGCHQVIPLPRSGLHCGSDVGMALDSDFQVIPLPRSGLHCGAPRARSDAPFSEVIPLPRSGLHCGMAVVIGCSRAGLVIPLPRSGLHCGAQPGSVGRGSGQVIPLPRSGLHCGKAMRAGGVGALARHPAPKERAPLRPVQCRGHRAPEGQSSRSQGAGSIAANFWVTLRGVVTRCHPAPKERAPLRRSCWKYSQR